MTEPDTALASILDFLSEKRGFDFAGCHREMLVRRIAKRLASTACGDFGEYLACLRRDAGALDRLIDVVTINVSRFFRDSLTFELIADRILPAVVREKAGTGEASLRIWSAGCAGGQEPYSVAILLHELQEKEGRKLDSHLFATDIDAGALKDARKALYTVSDIEDMKHRLLLKYFTPEGASFRLIPEIGASVHFSLYDMLDKQRGVPQESVFGGFDMVFCRNLLIYFNPDYQVRIFKKLHHALARNGYLILGEAETPPPALRHHFTRVFEFSPIYRRR
jgi:chemotaxis protein methyltransferase CheR